MNPDQLLGYIIRPTLQSMGARYNVPRVDIMLLATGANETGCGRTVHQIGGPALGWPQVEPHTMKLTWKWEARHALHLLRCKMAPPERLMSDWRLATIYARLVYYSCPDPVPPIDCDAMFSAPGGYKRCYNGPGKATLAGWRKNWARYVAPVLT